jgi:predicted Fe-S protein YdhL (DUF1289 family)
MIKSPCVKRCMLAPDGRVCTGCLRTPSEISGWVSMSDEQREAIMARCKASPWGTKCKTCIDSRDGPADPLADFEEAPF